MDDFPCHLFSDSLAGQCFIAIHPNYSHIQDLIGVVLWTGPDKGMKACLPWLFSGALSMRFTIFYSTCMYFMREPPDGHGQLTTLLNSEPRHISMAFLASRLVGCID